MQQDEHTRTQSTSFGEIAADYDRYRPGPPDEAVNWLLPQGAVDVIELGAGTGGLTRRLIERVEHVRAVEPDDRMRSVLGDRVPQAEAVAGQAEHIPAEDASADLVIMSSAWHWVDEPRAVPEVARVLRPGGRLSLLWSGPDRGIDWVASLFAGGQTLSAEQIARREARRRDRHTVDLGPDNPFTKPERRVIPWTLAMTKDDVVGLVATYSVAITMSPAARDAYVEGIERVFDAFEDVGTGGVCTMPMRCLCWRADLRLT